MGSITDKLQKLVNTKKGIKEAIIAKGVDISDEEAFSVYPDKILEIESQENKKITQNLLCGAYDSVPNIGISTIEITLHAEYDSENDIRDLSSVLPTLKKIFDNNLSYNSEIISLDDKSYLKLYKQNPQNAFLISCSIGWSADHWGDVLPDTNIIVLEFEAMIDGKILKQDNYYFLETQSSVNAGSLFYFYLNFCETDNAICWGVNSKYEYEREIYDLFAASVKATKLDYSFDKVYLHCIGYNAYDDSDNSSFLKFSDNSIDFENSLAERMLESSNLIDSDFVAMDNLYFLSEKLKTDNLFITKVFPNRYTSMLFELKGNLFCSSCCGNDTNNSRFVFLIN